MYTSIENKKAEAVFRMKMLHLHPDVIKIFDERGKLRCFEGCFGAISKVDGSDLEHIRQIEEENNLLVYAVVCGNHSRSYLFVSDEQEEWEDDRKTIEKSAKNNKDGVMAYVVSFSNPKHSGFSIVGIQQSMFGSLKRTW